MNTMPIIQSFLGSPVRFFQAEFAPTWGGYYTPPSFDTWAIPFPDFCEAIRQEEKEVRRKIKLDDEVFSGLYRTEAIIDRKGIQRRATILMAYEMCLLIIAKLQTSRIKDPSLRANIIRFQQWIMGIFYMIRTRRLRPARWAKLIDVDQKYLPLLSIPSGRDHKKQVIELAQAENKSLQTIYRHLKSIRRSNIITRKGQPRRTRIYKKAA
jgi:DNA-binding transcriptional ArsR family regulator